MDRQSKAAKIARRGILLALVAIQLFFVFRAYYAPHKHFGFQMFAEASTWRADIVRVTRSGERRSVLEPWAGYAWDTLVSEERGLRHAHSWVIPASGVRSSAAHLEECLDWIATHTPNDTETAYYEAQIHFVRNRRPEDSFVIRSRTR